MGKNIRWRGRHMGHLQMQLRNKDKMVAAIVAAIMRDAGADAAEHMRNVISTTPSAIVAGKNNRIYTGAMINAVGWEQVGKLGFKAGWIHDQEMYFLYQDLGAAKFGYHDVPLPAMYALHGRTGAELVTVEQLKETFGAVFK